MPKPYSGATSWKSFREHFERICRVNAWNSTADNVQNLTLALEGPAAEILKDVNEASPTAYDEIWSLQARRFGQTDAPRDAIRRFDNRRQTDNETIPQYEQALRVLHREAWPNATLSQRDTDLKRRFEDGVLNPEMSQFYAFTLVKTIFRPLYLKHDNLSMPVKPTDQKNLYAL